MSDMMLTKDAEKMLVIIYKEYLNRRESGVSKSEAKYFQDFDEWVVRLFPTENKNDARATQFELCRAFKMKTYIRGGFVLNDDAIIYMEQRFPNGAKQLLEWLAAIKNAIPFA